MIREMMIAFIIIMSGYNFIMVFRHSALGVAEQTSIDTSKKSSNFVERTDIIENDGETNITINNNVKGQENLTNVVVSSTPLEKENVTAAVGERTTMMMIHEKEHIVFIGDSTLRYSFLELLDQEHHQLDRLPPSELIHEKYHSNWTSFFKYTTEYFEGHMSCDCQRSEIWDLGTEIENRQYISPHNGNRYTYIQLYGDNQAHGRYHAKDVEKALISEPPDENRTSEIPEKPKVWGYMGEDLDKLILEYVAHLNPKPSAIVMNAGLWPNTRIAKNMDNIMRAAHEVSGVREKILYAS